MPASFPMNFIICYGNLSEALTKFFKIPKELWNWQKIIAEFAKLDCKLKKNQVKQCLVDFCYRLSKIKMPVMKILRIWIKN